MSRLHGTVPWIGLLSEIVTFLVHTPSILLSNVCDKRNTNIRRMYTHYMKYQSPAHYEQRLEHTHTTVPGQNVCIHNLICGVCV